MKRPFGVTVISVVQMVIGLYGLAVVVLFAIDAFSHLSTDPKLLLESRWAVWLGSQGTGDWADVAGTFLLLAFSVAYVPIGVGMWLLKTWAWRATIILQGFYLITGIYAFFRGRPVYTTWIGAIVIVLYLNQAEVKAAFARELLSWRTRNGR